METFRDCVPDEDCAAGGLQKVAVVSGAHLWASWCHRATGKHLGFIPSSLMVQPFPPPFFWKKKKKKSVSRPKSQACVACLSHTNGVPTQCLYQSQEESVFWMFSPRKFYMRMFLKVVLPPGRVVFSPDEQRVPVLAIEHSPPCVSELPSRAGGPRPWKRTLLVSLRVSLSTPQLCSSI